MVTLTKIEEIQKTIKRRSLETLSNWNGASWEALVNFIHARQCVLDKTEDRKASRRQLEDYPSLAPLWGGEAVLKIEIGEYDHYILMSEVKEVLPNAPKEGKVTEKDIEEVMVAAGYSIPAAQAIIDILIERKKLKTPRQGSPGLRVYATRSDRSTETATATVRAHDHVLEIGLTRV